MWNVALHIKHEDILLQLLKPWLLVWTPSCIYTPLPERSCLGSQEVYGNNMQILDLKDLKSPPQPHGISLSKAGTSCKLSIPSASLYALGLKQPKAVFLAESEILKLQSKIPIFGGLWDERKWEKVEGRSLYPKRHNSAFSFLDRKNRCQNQFFS